MNYAEIIFKAMRPDTEYDPGELSEMTHISRPDVNRCLKMLNRGGVIKNTHYDRYMRNRKYKSKQAQLKGL